MELTETATGDNDREKGASCCAPLPLFLSLSPSHPFPPLLSISPSCLLPSDVNLGPSYGWRSVVVWRRSQKGQNCKILLSHTLTSLPSTYTDLIRRQISSTNKQLQDLHLSLSWPCATSEGNTLSHTRECTMSCTLATIWLRSSNYRTLTQKRQITSISSSVSIYVSLYISCKATVVFAVLALEKCNLSFPPNYCKCTVVFGFLLRQQRMKC